MTENIPITISTYHEYLLEAILSLGEGLRRKGLESEIFSRYSFLMIANSLEAAANALLLDLNVESDYYEELEKLNTLMKFKTFCYFNKKKLNVGDVRFARIRDIISCRNEFVHPKPKQVDFNFDLKTNEIIFASSKTKNRNYPLYFSEIKSKHALTALEDTLSFVSWVCFDICKLKIDDGSLMLGLGSRSRTSDLTYLGEKYKIKFDQRTFGEIR